MALIDHFLFECLLARDILALSDIPFLLGIFMCGLVSSNLNHLLWCLHNLDVPDTFCIFRYYSIFGNPTMIFFSMGSTLFLSMLFRFPQMKRSLVK